MEQPIEDRGGYGIGKVGDEFDGTGVRKRVEKKILADNMHGRVLFELFLQGAGKPGVDLNGDQLFGLRCDEPGEHAFARPDLDNRVCGREIGGGDDLPGDVLVNQEVLAEFLTHKNLLPHNYNYFPTQNREKIFFRVVKAAFAQRRKTLSNTLKTTGVPAETLKVILDAAGIDGERRGETLSLDEFAALANVWIQ
jgi:hypothetical protein